MPTLDLTYFTWNDSIDLGGQPSKVEAAHEFIINSDANGFNAKVKLVNIKLGGTDDIIHYVDEAVIEVIEEDILEAAVSEDDAYYKRHAANDLPDDDDVSDIKGEGHMGAVG